MLLFLVLNVPSQEISNYPPPPRGTMEILQGRGWQKNKFSKKSMELKLNLNWGGERVQTKNPSVRGGMDISMEPHNIHSKSRVKVLKTLWEQIREEQVKYHVNRVCTEKIVKLDKLNVLQFSTETIYYKLM